ncbi:MAG TPA: DUF1844 domain-containing protein [Desulfonatronum sp.]|nr:DUF1844 domain-containing protein [Desulfonatronum sp.]
MEEFKVVDRRIQMDEKGAQEQEQGESAVNRARADEKAGRGAFAGCTMPQVCFPTFVLSLSSSALMHLGEVPDPETGKPMENILMAKHTIDILAMLAEKTRGNLNAEEAKLLKDMLFELRMKYVQKAS